MGIKTFKYDVTVLDIDYNNLLTNKGLLRILQEAANMASSEVGYGVDSIEKNQTTWALLSWRLNIYKRPSFSDTITVQTWPRGFNKFYSVREFKIFLNDELIGVASSKWVLIDIQNHKIQKITPELIEIYKPIEESVFDDETNEKYKLQDNLTTDFEYTIMRRDLDPNHHVNNTCHLDIALESLKDDIYNLNFSNMEIVYKKELLHKDKVSCSYIYENDKHYIYLTTCDKTVLNSVIILY